MTIFGIYVVLGYTFWGGMIALALCAALRVKGFTCRNIEIPFFFLFLLALVFFRWTLLTTNKEYHADESFFIAEGMKYLTDFLPWRSVDGTTSGPFDSWFIMWPLLVGLPMNYCTARVTGVVIIFLTVFFTQRLLRHVLDPEWSLVLILPLATMYCFLWERAFASYTSQDLSVALLAALAWVGFVSAKNPTPLRAFIIGLITGAIPFGKLQAAPAAAVITSSIFVAWILAAYRGALPRRKIGIVLLVAIGSIFLIPAAILIPVAAGGAFHDFWIRYPWASMANGAPRASGWIASTEMLREGRQITSYFLGVVGCAIAVAIALLLLRKTKKKRRFPIEASAALVAICGVSWYLVVRSGFPNGGYLFYVVLPALYVASFVLRELDTRLKLSEHYAELRKFAICQVAAISIFPQLATHLIMRVNMMETQEYQFENNFETNFSPNSQFGAVAQFLDKYRKPGDRLTLWGSRPAIYVYSGMTPGTRDIDCDIMLGANRDELTQIRWDKADYFKGVFIKDLNAVKPRFFIDVSRMYRRPEWGPPELTDATAVPAVADILKNEYNLMGTMNDPAKGPVAVVYIRKDE